ncbi:MAG: hypothetical protein LUH58_03710 [Lachnospiraceae bacterium]|nr:hypothetical protein [Lachnospiraceae bacterium]
MEKLLAGTAVRDITPTPQILEDLKSEGRYTYEGVAHPIYLKTLVLTDGNRKFVYFCTDLSRFTVNEEIQDRLEKELGLSEGDYLFSTIRTHNTISGFGVDLHDESKKGSSMYGQLFFDAVFDSCREAMKNLVPARIGAAEGESFITMRREQFSPAGNFESCNTSLPPAPWLRVVRVEDLQGATLALLVNYSMQNCMVCHYSMEGEGYDLITNDAAGEIVDYLERVGKHAYPVFWSNGGGADRQPMMYLTDYCDVDDNGVFSIRHQVLPIEASLMIMKFLAAEQGRDVMKTVEKISSYSDEFRLDTQVLNLKVPGKKRLFPAIENYHYTEDVRPVTDAPVEMRLQMTVLDGIAFCAANGPVYAGAYKALKDMLPFKVTVFFDDCLGGPHATVIPTPDMEEENKYVHATLQSYSYTARIGFNAFMGGFGKMLEKYMLKTVPTYGGVPYPDFDVLQ